MSSCSYSQCWRAPSWRRRVKLHVGLVHLGLGLILVQAIYLNISSISEKQFTIAHRIPACASTVLVPSITLVEWNARFPEPKWFKSEHPDVSRGKVAALDVHNVA